MHKTLAVLKVTWKILTRLNYCFQSTHSQTIAQLVFCCYSSPSFFRWNMFYIWKMFISR